MTDGLFTAESMAELLTAFKTQFPMAIGRHFTLRCCQPHSLF